MPATFWSIDSTSARSRWAAGARYLKRNLLGFVLGAVLVVGLYWLIWTTRGWWWLAAAGAFFCVTIVLGRIFPVLIMPLFYKIERLEAPELAQRLNSLAAGTGLSIEGVYRIALSEETVKANAMLAGLGNTRRVLLGDTLLNNFSPAEIAVVFAHEIGHHVFRHVRKMILLGLLVSVAGFWICDRLLMGFAAAGGQPFDYAALPIWTEPWIMLILSVFGLLLEPVMNGISRRHERQSDRYALERIGQPDAYISAFSKLARQNKDDPSPHWFEVFWLHDHPPIAERLAIARSSDSIAGASAGRRRSTASDAMTRVAQAEGMISLAEARLLYDFARGKGRLHRRGRQLPGAFHDRPSPRIHRRPPVARLHLRSPRRVCRHPGRKVRARGPRVVLQEHAAG